MPFGQFVMIAGGSLFQGIVPAVFAGYFSIIDNNLRGINEKNLRFLWVKQWDEPCVC
jgi:hypothetical protein